jgi:hypothetical protein
MIHDTGMFGRRSIGQKDNILFTLLPLKHCCYDCGLKHRKVLFHSPICNRNFCLLGVVI